MVKHGPTRFGSYFEPVRLLQARISAPIQQIPFFCLSSAMGSSYVCKERGTVLFSQYTVKSTKMEIQLTDLSH